MEFFPITPTRKETENCILFEDLKKYFKFHPNQRIFNDYFYSGEITKEEDELLRKNNLVIDLYDFEIA